MFCTRIAAIAMVSFVLWLDTLTVWANDSIHNAVKQSTVWIVRPDGGSGSGVLIDKGRGLVASVDHLFEGQPEVAVFAPLNDTDGENWDRESYLREAARLVRLGYATTGRVIAFDRSKDLAIVRLSSALKGLREIDIADDAPEKGDELHIVGNPGERPLFSYSYGGVQFAEHVDLSFSDGEHLDANIIHFSGHIWPGNSGGPVVNKSGNLVGVVTRTGKATATAIATSEIRDLLNSIETHHVFSIDNPTNLTLRYQIRYGDGEWQFFTLDSGISRTHWNTSSIRPEILFDWSFADGFQAEQYNIEKFSALYGRGMQPNKKDDAREYYFSRTSYGIDLFAR